MSIGTFIGIVIAFFVGYFLKEIEGEEKMLEKSQIALVRLGFDF